MLLAACFPSLDNLIGAAGAGDGGGAGSADGGAGAGDATQASDGAAPLDGATALGPFCERPTSAGAFCCEFDPADLSVCGLSGDTYGSGTFQLVDTPVSSAPGAALFTIPATDGGYDDFSRTELAYKSAGSSNAESDIVFALRIEKLGTATSTGLVLFDFQTQSQHYEARLNLDSTGHLFISQIDDKTSTYDEPFKAPLPLALGTWLQIHYHFRIQSQGQGTADLDVGGQRIVSALAMKPSLPAGTLSTQFGLNFVRLPTSGYQILLDDLLIKPK